MSTPAPNKWVVTAAIGFGSLMAAIERVGVVDDLRDLGGIDRRQLDEALQRRVIHAGRTGGSLQQFLFAQVVTIRAVEIARGTRRLGHGVKSPLADFAEQHRRVIFVNHTMPSANESLVASAAGLENSSIQISFRHSGSLPPLSTKERQGCLLDLGPIYRVKGSQEEIQNKLDGGSIKDGMVK